MTIAIFLGSLLAAMAIGIPISFSLLLCGAALMWHLDIFDAQILAQNVIEGANSFPLLAVPFFMLAGEIMNAGGLSRRIVNFAMSLVGHIKGGLGYVAILSACIMAALSGSAVADAAALSALLLPMMVAAGHDKARSAGLLASASIIAPIIPPSIFMVIYASMTNASIGGLFAAASANTFNCVIDADIDEVMRRTRRRPVPRHQVSAGNATAFGVVLGILATLVLGFGANWLSAILALAANAFYVFVYTMWLKRRTWQNIVWGGIAGCFPPLIGWTAVTDAVAWPPLILFLIVFWWTPPHTWALGLRYRDDYAGASLPMLPVVLKRKPVVCC